MAKYLNDTGLSHLMTKLKTWAAASFAPTSHTHTASEAPGSVTGVKGNSESSYRTGDVNLTPANIGAVAKSGDTMTGNLVVPKTRIANTYYGVSFGRTKETPVETILYTGIKWVSGAHMPVIHVTGYAYGLQSPVEFKIAFYIYSNKIGWCGATNMGSWNPSIKLFKHTVDSVDYVAVGFSGSCYFLQLQVDVQDEMGKFLYTDLTSSLWSWSFLTTAGTIPEADSGVTCIAVPYKADILVPNMANASGTLPISHGGTGATTAAGAADAIFGGLPAWTADPTDNTYLPRQDTGGGASYGKVKFSTVWNYIKGKFTSTMLSSATDSSSESLAATPKAVKAAYDLANGANTTAGQALSAATGALAFKVTYSVSGSDVVCAAHVYSGGSEVTSDHADSCFVWSMSLDGGATWASLGTGKTKTVSAMSTYGGNVKCDFTPAS